MKRDARRRGARCPSQNRGKEDGAMRKLNCEHLRRNGNRYSCTKKPHATYTYGTVCLWCPLEEKPEPVTQGQIDAFAKLREEMGGGK